MPKVRKTSLRRCKELVQNQTEASLALARKVSEKTLKKNKNLVFSPLSLNLVIGMIAAGSSGETRDELFKYLKQRSLDDIHKLYSEIVSRIFVDGSPVGGPKLAMANSVWIQKGLPLKDSFKQVVDNVYKSSFHRANFIKNPEKARLRVNSWGEEKTNGLVKEVLSPNSVSDKTRLLLANALYFKGIWRKPFDPLKTQKEKFHLLDGKTIEASFMKSYDDRLISTFDGFKVLGLFYEHGEDQRRFSMNIYLPDTNDGLPALMEKMWSETGFLDSHLPSEWARVGNFGLPKFKISFKLKASKILKQLGLELPFNHGALTEMVVDHPLEVNEICHKSYIELNEQGTEAAAITVLATEEWSCGTPSPPPIVDFVADHPFMFVIREHISQVVLFVGHVLNPLEE